jgi:hypothetical protein
MTNTCRIALVEAATGVNTGVDEPLHDVVNKRASRTLETDRIPKKARSFIIVRK